MTEKQKNFYNLLVNNYKVYTEKERKETNKLFQSLYRDKINKISQVFEKNFHKSIDKAEML